jgi:hypothetical protein
VPAAAAPGEVTDIDAKYRNPYNIYMVPEFVNDIFAHLKHKEQAEAVAPAYMSSQGEITTNMRAVLVDWLVNVCTKRSCAPETMYLCVRILDRFLSLRSVQKAKLQLVGLVAFQIASKVEEIYSYSVQQLLELVRHQYRRDEFIRMERYMLATLQWGVTSATAMHFLQRYVRAAGLPRTSVQLASYLSELVLLDYGMLKYSPSMHAAAAVYVTLRMTGTPVWVRAAMVRFVACRLTSVLRAADGHPAALHRLRGGGSARLCGGGAGASTGGGHVVAADRASQVLRGGALRCGTHGGAGRAVRTRACKGMLPEGWGGRAKRIKC